MGHIEGEDALSSKAFSRVGNPKQKMAKKNSWSKAAKPSFSSHLFCSPLYERESWRDERRETQRGIRTRTHTHTERERVFKKS